ncbi:unnamed protein product, partial [marine sediment metagenome]
ETITTSPHSAQSYWLLGQSYAQMGQLEKAKENYQKALDLDPGHLKGNYWLAKVCMRLKEPDEAKKYMQAHTAITAEEEQRRNTWAENRGHSAPVDTSEKEILAFPIALAGMSVRGYKLYEIQKSINASKHLFDKVETTFEKTISIDPKQHTVFQETRPDGHRKMDDSRLPHNRSSPASYRPFGRSHPGSWDLACRSDMLRRKNVLLNALSSLAR